MNLLERVGTPLRSVLLPDEEPRVAFLGSNFDVSALDGGSTRIVAVTQHGIAVVRTGLLRRLKPYKVESRHSLTELKNPFFAWPGRTLIGEEYAEILDGIWVHRRWRSDVVEAFAISVEHAH